MQNINLQGGSFKKISPESDRPLNHDIYYDIFYGEIHLPSEHQVYMPYKPTRPHWNVRAMNLINEIYGYMILELYTIHTTTGI